MKKSYLPYRKIKWKEGVALHFHKPPPCRVRVRGFSYPRLHPGCGSMLSDWSLWRNTGVTQMCSCKREADPTSLTSLGLFSIKDSKSKFNRLQFLKVTLRGLWNHVNVPTRCHINLLVLLAHLKTLVYWCTCPLGCWQASLCNVRVHTYLYHFWFDNQSYFKKSWRSWWWIELFRNSGFCLKAPHSRLATDAAGLHPWVTGLTLFIFFFLKKCLPNSQVWITMVCESFFQVKMVCPEKKIVATSAHSSKQLSSVFLWKTTIKPWQAEVLCRFPISLILILKRCAFKSIPET